MSTTVKIAFEEDIRRIALPNESPFDHLIKEINRIYTGRFPTGIHVRYVDDEDDFVTVTCNMELKDALDLGESTLKLYISQRTDDPEKEADFVKVSKDGQRTVTLSKPEPKQSTPAPQELPEDKHKETFDETPGKDEVETIVPDTEKAKAKAQKIQEKEAKKLARLEKKAARQAAKEEKAARKALLSKLNCKFLEDISYPDETKVLAGSTFIKTWLVKNTGTVSWQEGTKFRVGGKGALSAVRTLEIPLLKPGEEGKLSVEFATPERAGKMKSNVYTLEYEGKKFGDSFWAIVRVERQSPKKVPRHGDSKKDTKSKIVLGAHFIKDLNFPDDVLVAPGQALEKSWLIKNTGECSWPIGTKLVHIEGTFGEGTGNEIKTTVRKGEQYRLTVRLVAPMTTGKFTASYRLQGPDGDRFGHKYWINVQVSKFPNREQLRGLFKNFLADQKVVDILHREFPMVIKEVRQGKGIASIVEGLIKKHPELKTHQFVVFIQPFLHSAEKFMNMQMETLISMYSFWAMTPFSSGATVLPVTSEAKPEPKDGDKKIKADQKHEKEKSEKKSYKDALKARQEKTPQKATPKKYKYANQLEHFQAMGFKNLHKVKPLLDKHKGNVQAVMNELFHAN